MSYAWLVKVGDYVGAWVCPCIYIPLLYYAETSGSTPDGSTKKFMKEIYSCTVCRERCNDCDCDCGYNEINE